MAEFMADPKGVADSAATSATRGRAPMPPATRTILAYAPGGWGWPHFAGSPRYHLWTLAGLGWRVIYVEPPRKLTRQSVHWRAPDRDFHVVTPGLCVPFGVPGVKLGAVGEMLRALASKRLSVAAMDALRLLGARPDVVWFGSPWHTDLASLPPCGPAPPPRETGKRLKDGPPAPPPPPPLRIVHIYDDLPASPIFRQKEHAKQLWLWELDLLRKCDIALASSRPQLESREGFAARTELLENAVADSFFEASASPAARELARPFLEALETIPKPRLMYGGVADHRLDAELFLAALEHNPALHIVFCGKQDRNLDRRLADQAGGRLHFLGSVPYQAFPLVLGRADALILAHRRSEFTDAMFPEKLNEYLATGRPIVSIDLPEVVRVAGEGPPGAIRVGGTAAALNQAIDAALKDSEGALRAARVELARRRTWSAMGRRLDSLLREALAVRK